MKEEQSDAYEAVPSLEEREHVMNSSNQREPIQVHYAGFWMRFWAYLLDLLVISALTRLLVYPLFRLAGIEIDDPGLFSPAAIASALVFYLYFILMTKFFGQTLGKMVFGLRVISLRDSRLSWGTILFRELVGRYISATIIILYLITAFMPKKQGLHDFFADTAVVHERSLAENKPAYV
ncbi:MAG TPA: RDD family protein [Chondromyces sp.]|nr:RDD family protein [Chondromyces sp.]